MIRQIYISAKKRDYDNPMLLQQEALFEMHSPDGSLDKASELLQKATKLAPYNKALVHSLSELARKKAENSVNEIEKNKYRQDAMKIAETLIRGSITAHPYHTLIKIGLDELEDLLIKGDEASTERKIKDLEKSISSALQQFPDDSYIRDVEANFCTLISKHEQALKALERAFEVNKRSSYIASRLAKVYEANKKLPDAIRILNECLEVNPSEKHINYQVAMLLYQTPNSNRADILHHLRRSFTIGDNNYVAQFWCARHLYLDGSRSDAIELFQRLSDVNIDSRVKREPRGIVTENDVPKRFAGIVSKIEASYAFIIRDEIQDAIFTYSAHNDPNEWNKLSYHKRVKFDLGFNYRGPYALNVSLE